KLPSNVICGMILQAQTRVVYAAASLNDAIASALMTQHKVLGDRVTVILDYDESLFRMGYGLADSVSMLQEKGIPLRKQPGLRIGSLILDDLGWCFTLPPMAVE